MTTLQERAAERAGRVGVASAQDAEGGTFGPSDSLPDYGIPEPGEDGPEQVPVHVAWSRVMGSVRNINKEAWHGDPKDRNSFRFRGVDAALNAFGPACRLHGVLVLPVHTDAAHRDVKTSTGKPSRECTVTVTYRIIGPMADFIEVQSVGESMDSADKGTAKALSTALRSLLFLGGLVPTGDPDPDSINVERGDAPIRPAVEYLDEIVNPGTSLGRLRQIHAELKQTRQIGALVTNEVGDDEQIGAMVVRIGHERKQEAGGAS